MIIINKNRPIRFKIKGLIIIILSEPRNDYNHTSGCHSHTLTTMRHHAPTPRRPRDVEPPRPGAPAPPRRRALMPPCSLTPVYLLLQSMILLRNVMLTLLGPYAASSLRLRVVLCLPALVLLMPLASPSLIEGRRVRTSAPCHSGPGWQGFPPTLRSGRGVCEARLGRRQWKSAIHGMSGGRTWEASTWGQSNVEHATTCHKNYRWGTLQMFNRIQR